MISLNINKLRSEVEDREKKKYKIFENILEMCYKKILNTNKQSNEYSCTFIVPNFVFGLPLYSIGDCVQFIMDKLLEKGFEIYFALPTTIHISWKPENHNHTHNHNTIEYYNNNLMIKYNGDSNSNNNNNSNSNNQKNKKNNNNNNNINYKSINEYKETKDVIYDLDELDIFQSKVANIF